MDYHVSIQVAKSVKRNWRTVLLNWLSTKVIKLKTSSEHLKTIRKLNVGWKFQSHLAPFSARRDCQTSRLGIIWKVVRDAKSGAPISDLFNGNLNFSKILQVIQRHSKTQEALLLVHNSHYLGEGTVCHKWCNLSETL